MSKYVEVNLSLAAASSLVELCDNIAIPYSKADFGVATMLPASLECAGEPVDIRYNTDALATIDQFGLRCAGDSIVLVCGEFDTQLLNESFVPRLKQAAAQVTAKGRLATSTQRVRGVSTYGSTQRIVLGGNDEDTE